MIVPRNRLLLWFAVVVIPFATLGGVVPETAPWCGGVVGLFLLAVALDALLTVKALHGVGIELPPLTRGTQGRSFRLAVRLRNPGGRARTLRVALSFPPSLPSDTEELTITLPAENEWSMFEWECRGEKRGRMTIPMARLEASSPLGFWARWRTVSTPCEIRIYPSLLAERNNLAALFLNRGAFGVHARRQVGRGREFEKLRDYSPGDGMEDVHWKATAKRGHPVTKVFQIERTQEVYVVIDASRLSARPVTAGQPESSPHGPEHGVTTLERFITSALVLGLAAEQQGDLFGLLTFSDKIETFLRARNEAAHYHACRDALYALQPREVAPDFDELSIFLRTRLRRRALLLFLTSLDDPVAAESFVRNMDLVCRQHLILVNMLQPDGVRPIFSDDTLTSAGQIYGELAGHLRWQKLRELEKVLRRRGVRLALLPNERLAVDLVSQYMNVKQRQLL